jgi:hypothetical protein
MKSKSLQSIALSFGIALVLPLAHADIIFISGVNNIGTDNVLFNDSTLPHSGSLVQGNFSGSGLGYVVNFTSSSGNNQIMGSGGQAILEGLTGNDPFTALSFSLSGAAQTFTKAVFNVDAISNSDLSVTTLEPDGQLSTATFIAGGNGENFVTVEAINGQSIRSITLTNTGGMENVNQFRIGGFAGGVSVPDGGTTLALLGLALGALGLAKRKMEA